MIRLKHKRKIHIKSNTHAYMRINRKKFQFIRMPNMRTCSICIWNKCMYIGSAHISLWNTCFYIYWRGKSEREIQWLTEFSSFFLSFWPSISEIRRWFYCFTETEGGKKYGWLGVMGVHKAPKTKHLRHPPHTTLIKKTTVFLHSL